jgi:hypothetical protein
MEITAPTAKQFKCKSKTTNLLCAGKEVIIEKNTGEKMTISEQGEYEVAGVSVIGSKNAYVLEIDGVRICYVFNYAEKLPENELAELGSIDIALLQTEGDNKLSAEIARQLDPWVMIPSPFNATDFMKVLGVSTYEPVNKYAVASRDKLPSELQIVVLSSK